jgi:hypothetical protein
VPVPDLLADRLLRLGAHCRGISTVATRTGGMSRVSWVGQY